MADERQRVVCVWCRRQGPSPVKKRLREPGRDYPLWCRDCNAVGVIPVDDPDAARYLEPEPPPPPRRPQPSQPCLPLA